MDLDTLRRALDPTWLPWLLALGVSLPALAVLEGLALQHLARQPYDWTHLGLSLADALGRRAVDALGLSLAAPVLVWAYTHRLGTWRLDGPGPWLAVFLLHEACYYAYHRAAHRVGWFWATHSVHHSPPALNLACALRLGWTGKLSGTALFFSPLVLLGVPPTVVLGATAFNLVYQFWLHTTWIPRLGPLEWVFNTPSHHRVHHGSNPEYLDCNYGGVLIVYDRLLGTWVGERDGLPPRYGLVQPLDSRNPLVIAFHGWIRLLRDVRQAGTMRGVLAVLLGPPGGARSSALPDSRSCEQAANAPARRLPAPGSSPRRSA
ncbi:sterol desaturase family protein [Ideonella livida]|uniref:Sterol desaturase family protein n=1 Tax=Ideonella livida TaxID=2707176 RepID=A0A7C9TKQ7_9BURK|nr:sterol desaturase family protein [Ideonella livida]NDY91067.1 sterol desaturase family protein [Ideonella livida]